MVTRLTGLASGFDTETTVSKLMSAARMPLNLLTQKKQLLQWQRDDYRTLNAKILAFRTLASDMKIPSKYQSKQASSADDSAVSVTASAVANEGVYKIKVAKLAETASLTSGKLTEGKGSETMKLSELGLVDNTTFTISGAKGSATIELKKDESIAQFIANANGKSNTTGVKVNYDATLNKIMFVTSSTGEASKINIKMQGNKDIFNLGFPKPTVPPTEPSTEEPSTEEPSTEEPSTEEPSTESLTAMLTEPPKGQTIVGGKGFESSTSYINNDLTSPQQFKIKINAGTTEEFAVGFDVTKNTTLSQLVDSINASELGKSKGLSAYVDTSDKSAAPKTIAKLAFFNTNDANKVSFENGITGNVIDKLGLGSSKVISLPLSYSEIDVKGQDAEVYFNGSTDPVKYANNSFTISGMTFNAKKVTTEPVSVTVSKDVDSVYNTIKNVIDKYNELIDAINTKTAEKKYPSFTPLTDEQKKDMKEDDITKWNAKAMSGMLSNDQILSSGINSFRSAISGVVQGLPGGQLKSLSEIGISTSLVTGKTVSGSYLDKGKLYIDDAKLKAAISNNPDEVLKLFLANDNDKETDVGDGIAVRMYDQANQLFNKISSKAGLQTSVDNSYIIGKAMKDIDKRADSLSLRLDALETRYYKQFTSMESYINKMNTQSANLTKQFG